MMKSSREFSDLQESQLCKLFKSFGAKVTSNSGGTKFGGGDLLTNDFLIEAKTVEKEKSSFSIKESWLTKAKEQSFEQGRAKYCLAFQFKPQGTNYFVIDEKHMKEYMELLNKEKQDESR